MRTDSGRTIGRGHDGQIVASFGSDPTHLVVDVFGYYSDGG
jgi:hypothetical protein